MQDRLKSRVWDPQEKKMHYNDFVITSTGYVAKVERQTDDLDKFVIDQTDLEFDKTMTVMQCTGLKDKNSKLIYEGDIVEILHSGNKKAFIYWDNDNYCYKLKGNGVAYNAHITIRNDYIEIIGNIYENPKLLKGGVA